MVNVVSKLMHSALQHATKRRMVLTILIVPLGPAVDFVALFRVIGSLSYGSYLVVLIDMANNSITSQTLLMLLVVWYSI
jgi:hypothetical protein